MSRIYSTGKVCFPNKTATCWSLDPGMALSVLCRVSLPFFPITLLHSRDGMFTKKPKGADLQ